MLQDVGHLLHNMENETGATSELTQIIANIEQHFSKLCSIVQKHKHEVIDIVTKLKNAEKTSLHTAKDDLTVAIKQATKVMDSIRMTSNPKKIKMVSFALSTSQMLTLNIGILRRIDITFAE